MKRREAAVLALTWMLVAAGCRPVASDRATATTHAFLAGLARGDGSAVCERLTEDGVSELLLLALEHRVRVSSADARAPDTCARIAERLPAHGANALLRSRVERVVLHGDRATVETAAGSYETQEHEGQWRVNRFEPVARALRRTPPARRPVTLVVVRPDLTRPALGTSVAGETTDRELELTGTLSPPDARVRAREAQTSGACGSSPRDPATTTARGQGAAGGAVSDRRRTRA